MAERDVMLMADGIEQLTPARSLLGVRKLIHRIGVLLRRRTIRRRKIEERMEELKKELARLADKLGDFPESVELRMLANRAYAYCDAHREKLEEQVDGRTVSFDDGSKFGWRDTPNALEVIDEEALLASIRGARLMKELVTRVPKIDLNRIKNDSEIRSKLRGIAYGNRMLFRIEPAETDERLEAEAGKENPSWEIKRPRSRVVA